MIDDRFGTEGNAGRVMVPDHFDKVDGLRVDESPPIPKPRRRNKNLGRISLSSK
jgi:hypothetical protein